MKRKHSASRMMLLWMILERSLMGYVKLILEALGIFAVSIFVLVAVKIFTSPRNVATGIGVLRGDGLLLFIVGLFYVAFGLFLRSPLPERLLRRLSGVPN